MSATNGPQSLAGPKSSSSSNARQVMPLPTSTPYGNDARSHSPIFEHDVMDLNEKEKNHQHVVHPGDAFDIYGDEEEADSAYIHYVLQPTLNTNVY